jgi:hypothetical protein
LFHAHRQQRRPGQAPLIRLLGLLRRACLPTCPFQAL